MASMSSSREALTPSSVSDGTSCGETWYAARWKQALQTLNVGLDEVDRQQLERFATCDDLLRHLEQLKGEYRDENSPVPLVLSQLEPSLKRINGFAIALTLSLKVNFFRIAILWGILSLIVECAKETDNILTKIIEMLQQLTHDMEIFEIHRDSFKMESQMEEALVEIFMDITLWGVFSIRFLRDNQFVNMGKNAWPTFSKRFQETCRKVNIGMANIKEKANAYSLRETRRHQQTSAENIWQFGQMTLHGSSLYETDEEFFKPRHNIPFPKNDGFFGRESALKEVRDALNHDPDSHHFRSFALWGTGGIGKTQIALAYSRERQNQGVKAIFWISCETSMARNQSYTDVALLLELKGAAEGNHDQNRILVTKWLQRTTVPWLIIFDNVEISDGSGPNDANDIREYWPCGDHGSVLVTSRHKAVSLGPAASCLEVLVFSPEKGSSYLQSALQKKQPSRLPYSEEENKAAKELTTLLGGLPLALHIMANHILLKGKSIQQFVKFYETNYQRLYKTPKKQDPNLYYTHSLETCWLITFDAMEKESRDACVLIATLCFMSPDNIPEELFSTEGKKGFPQEMQFCKDSWSFDEAVDTLLELTLIRKESGSDMSLHRIVQSVYRDRISDQQVYDSFLATSTLLLEAFPKQVDGEPLRKEWISCRRFEQHALALVVRYREFSFKPQKRGDFEDFTELLTNVAWYLIETGSWNQCMEMVTAGLDACEDKESLWYAHLCASAACVHAERAHTELAHPFFNESIRIREKLLPATHQELANIYASLANMLLTEQRTPEAPAKAIELYDRAITIDNLKPPGPKLYGHLFIRYINRGFALACQKKYDDAYQTMELAREYALKRFGPGCHWEADCDYNEGFVFYQKGDWQAAKKLYERCLKVYLEENELHPATTATLFKLACVDLKQGKIPEAIQGLRKTELRGKINENIKRDQGETARVWRRLAEALEMNGEMEESARLKEAAEKVRREIQGSRYEELPDSEDSYNMLVCMNFW